MTAISVQEAATTLGVLPRAVRRMINEGTLPARPSGGSWAIDTDDLPSVPRVSKPMSPRVAWAAIIGPDKAHWLTKAEKAKLHRMLDKAIADGDVVRIASWLTSRGQATQYVLADPTKLLTDRRLIATGVNDSRASHNQQPLFEFYVQPGNLRAVEADHQLTKTHHGRVAIREAGWELPDPAPIILVVADMVDRGNEEQAKALLREAS